MKKITIKLPGAHGSLRLELDGQGSGLVSSKGLRDGGEDDEPNEAFDGAIDAIESLVLAHACAGVDVQDAKYVAGLETALESIANNLL